MLVDLTVNVAELERKKAICKEHNIDERFLISHSDNHIETGVYRGAGLGLSRSEFIEMENLTYDDEYYAMVKEWFVGENGLRFPVDMDSQYGVADNIEQIKEHYKEWIEKSDWVIEVNPVYQEKENAGKGGGWRWHKWGEYIGKLNPQCEYLDDEDFGDDWQGYVLCYHIYPVKK